jgi:predicted 3-demethylubiquinone-9 3-methyltransferase (glyoxalase superfamily)
MQTIVPHLWFEKGAGKAAELYVKAFPGSKVLSRSVLSDTPSGEVDVARLSLAGYEIQLLGAGPEFKVNPTLSFLYYADSKDQVDAVYAALKEGGSELMPLDKYPFSERYVWLQDRYGVSWQIGFMSGSHLKSKIVPAQMFVGGNAGKAAEALAFYTKLFAGESLLVSKYGPGMEPNGADMLSHAVFTLRDQAFAIMDSAYPPQFAFNEALSYLVYCDSQDEIDRLWAALSSDPAAEACGWCKDRYGFSWQIVPRELDALMSGPPEEAGRVTQAFMKMKKLDVAALKKAAKG